MTIVMNKKEHFLVFTKDGTDKQVRYDLKLYQMQKTTDDIHWNNVENSYKFFRGINIADIQFTDEKFKKFIEKVKNLYPNCSSISTFIKRIDECKNLEPYISENVNILVKTNHWCKNKYDIEYIKPITLFSKQTIDFFRNTNIYLEYDFIDNYMDNKIFFDRLFLMVQKEKYNEEEKSNLMVLFQNSHKFNTFKNLVKDKKFDEISLFNYCLKYLAPFENIKIEEAIGLLSDYCEMAEIMERKVKKYPKYLKSLHDIITANYNAFKQEYDEIKFLKRQRKELEYEGKEFSIVIPKTTKEVIQEGVSLNHCVSSYVPKIIKGETYIMFLRYTKHKQESLITLEVKDKLIIQAKGCYNRHLEKEEINFLTGYCREKQMEMKI